MPTDDELVLSPSSLTAYRECHHRYYLQYLQGHDQGRTYHSARGVAVHAAAEAFLNARLQWMPFTIDDAVAIYWTTYLLEMIGVDDSGAHPKYGEIGERVVRAYLGDIGEPVYVEEPIEITANGIRIVMHPDWADVWDVVHDLKVKESKPQYVDAYADAMNTYALGHRAVTGRIERDVQLDVMIALKRDQPYLVPIKNGGPVSRFAISRTIGRYEDAANDISAGRFEPNGLETGACRYCHVRTDCVYVTPPQEA